MQKQYYQIVKDYLLQLNFDITHENVEDSVLVINKKSEGINNLIIGVASPILILEQHLFDINNGSEEMFRTLLQKNRDIIHGAFVLDETGKKVIFRNTLQMASLDINELESTINSLSLLLSEFSTQIINFSKQ